MKSTKAFPTSAQSLEKHNGRDLSGMDLRDYFAARAMQAYMTRTIGISGFDEDVIAEMSYKVAEAMMRARDE